MNNIIPKDKSEDYIFERKKNEDINNQFIKEKRNIPKKDIESKDKDDRNNKLNNLKINDFSLSFIGQNSKKIFRALKEQNQQNFSIFPNEDDESVDVSNNAPFKSSKAFTKRSISKGLYCSNSSSKS